MTNGALIVVSGPSGCGKDTVVQKLLEKMGDKAYLSVSMTTRKIRPGEVDGENYIFVSKQEFQECIASGKMLEYAVYGENYYGTPLEPVQRLTAQGKVVFLIIEVQGGANIRKKCPEAKEIFLLPPSLEVLEKRLRGRQSDSEESILKRLEIAKKELEKAQEYDFQVVNDNLDDTVNELYNIVKKIMEGNDEKS